jgi:hypothetical protein
MRTTKKTIPKHNIQGDVAMKRVIFYFLLFLIGCTPNPAPTPTASPNYCLGFIIISDASYNCSETGNRALIASVDQQITLEGFGASIVIQGQTEIVQSEQSLLIRVLSGTAVIGARGRSRVVSASNFVELALLDGTAQTPSEAIPINITPNPLPAENTEIVQLSPTASLEGDCTLREDWGQSYTVEAGDVLEEIAEAYGLTIEEIAEANCLIDPSRLRIGQVLRIAGDTPTATASAIAFRADSYSLSEGECTILRWDAFNVSEVRLINGEVLQNSFLEVCPTETTTYTLQVVFLDGTETEGELTITVEED